MLYACDAKWWIHRVGVPEFKGLKVSQDATPFEDVRRVRLQRVDKLFFDGRIGWGGNSGFQALNLVLQCGVARVILVGLDMRVDHGVHWHGRHTHGLHNPVASTTERWRRALDEAAPVIARRGVEVLNASPISALRAYRKVDFREALA